MGKEKRIKRRLEIRDWKSGELGSLQLRLGRNPQFRMSHLQFPFPISFAQEPDDGGDGSEEHQGDEAGGEGFGFAVRDRLPAHGGPPAENSAEEEGHDQGRPFREAEALAEEDAPDGGKPAEEAAGHEGGFRGGGIRQEAGKAAENEENTKADQPARVVHGRKTSSDPRGDKLGVKDRQFTTDVAGVTVVVAVIRMVIWGFQMVGDRAWWLR